MKTKLDPRHLARKATIQALFEWTFFSRDPEELIKDTFTRMEEEESAQTLLGKESPRTDPQYDKNLTKELISGILANKEDIDQIICSCAPEWPINQIARIDLSILRLAVFELLFAKKVPPKVAIDEAIELGKEFGGENTGKFINGVLGTVMKLRGNGNNVST